MGRRKILTMLAAAAGAVLMAAAVTASPAKADTSGTTTSLWLQSGTVVWGAEYAFEMAVGVNAPAGNWAITAGSPTFGRKTLCSGDLSTSTYCFMQDGALPPGTYNLIATYNGTEDYSPSASGLEQLTVLPAEPANVSLGLSTATVTAGQEQSDVISFSATDAVTGRPAEGTVTVAANGVTLSHCDSVWVFLDSGGTASCTLTASELPPGSYTLTATFDGSSDGWGTATATRTLTVNAPAAVIGSAATYVSLWLSATQIAAGSQHAERFTAQASGIDGPPTGQLTFQAGSTTICTVTIGDDSNGTGTCSPAAGLLSPGSYQITATYSGDTWFAGSVSPPQTLTVTS